MELRSIHKDKRGTIFLLSIKNKKYLVLETFKGYRRGGDYHSSDQHDVVLKGKIKCKSPNMNRILIEGDSITFKAFEPHYIEALEDSLVLEWLEGDYKKWYYKKYRKLVEETLK